MQHGKKANQEAMPYSQSESAIPPHVLVFDEKEEAERQEQPGR